MMSLKLVPPTLIALLIVNGVGAQDWGVTYRPNSICALKGSTVIMSCSYSYPRGHRVQTAFWSKELVRPGSEPPDLLDDPEYRGRVQYIGNKQRDCSLRLRDVRENDRRKYYFRFITNKEGGRYQGKDGVDLSLPDLQVEGPERVMEGDEVTLTCKTTCRLTERPSFTWYRNGAPLSSSSEHLYLQSVSREDTGRYSCSVLDQNLHSPEVTLNVRWSVTLHVIGGVVVGCVGLILVLVILFIRRKRRGPVTGDSRPKQENIYSSVVVRATSNDPPADAANQDDGLYARVQPTRPKKPRTKERSAVSHDEVQYSTIQHRHGQQAEKTGEDDVQYATVSFSRSTMNDKSGKPEDPSVIYSGMK